MHCQYCGKDIGALRLLKDREFCSSAHRRSYKDRLGKVLTQMAATEAPPPPPAGFRNNLPAQSSNPCPRMFLWLSGESTYPVCTKMDWPLTITAEVEPTPIIDGIPHDDSPAEIPAPYPAWFTSPEPQPAERWLERSLAEPQSGAILPVHLVAPALSVELGSRRPNRCEAWLPLAAEPVAAFVQLSVADVHPAAHVTAFPAAMALVIDTAFTPPDLCEGWLSLAAEPVAAFVGSSVADALPAARALALPEATALVIDTAFTPPDLCEGWLSLAAEPVAAFVGSSVADVLPAARALALPDATALVIDTAFTPPDLCDSWIPLSAEPAAAFVGSSVADLLPAAGTTTLPGVLALAIDTALTPPDLCATPFPVAAEPAVPVTGAVPSRESHPPLRVAMPEAPALAIDTAFTLPDRCETSLPLTAEPAARLVRSTAFDQVDAAFGGARPAFDLNFSVRHLQLHETPAIAPAVEPVTAWPQAASAAEVLPSTAPTFTLPFDIRADLEPLPLHDTQLEPPALCERWATSGHAEPVWSFLESASAGVIRRAAVQAQPILAVTVTGPYVPLATGSRPLPRPEPVMAGVWPRMAETALYKIAAAPLLLLPAFFDAAPGPGSAAARSLVPAAIPPAAVDGADAPGIATAGPMAGSTAVRLQPFALHRGGESGFPRQDKPQVVVRAAEPLPATGKQPEPQPVSTLRVAVPEPGNLRPTTAMPRAGYIALEYHMQRTRSTTFSRPEWKAAHFEPLPPRFELRAVLEKLDDLAKPKDAAPATIFPMPEPRRARSVLMQHAGRIAAAIVIVTSIWLGAAAIKSRARLNVRPDDASFTASNRMLTAEPRTGAAQAPPAPGAMNWMRRNLASRATVQVGEDFQHGMQSWGAEASAYASGWQRHADGYVRPGALAIFSPTRTFTDYRLEFFGQIEKKSVGWVVRARDEKNYHAMKFTMLEAGLRPIIAMVHYNVIEGKAGRAVQTPLNVMVHNNRPLQVAVNVRGNRMVTSVDGEEVDSYINDVLPTGGVGFFSDAGEHARLYWAKVTKNDDWLGHICAFFSSGNTQDTAELWPPAVGGEPFAPWLPADEHSQVAAAGMAIPYFRRNYTRRQKQCNS